MMVKQKGDLVAEILETTGELTCHSQFNQGVNLKLADHLLFIGDEQKGCVPFGIHLGTEDFQLLKERVNWQKSFKKTTNGIQLDQIHLDLKSCPTYDNRLSLKRIDFRELDGVYRCISSRITETGLDFSSLLAENIFCKAVERPQLSAEFVMKYIGRGLGLTPAGDDFIIGLLAVDTVQPFLPATFRSLLKTALLEKRTTNISESYLLSAIDGHFSSLVKETFNWSSPQLSQKIAALAASGSTSGCDTLTGIVSGLQHIQENDRRLQ